MTTQHTDNGTYKQLTWLELREATKGKWPHIFEDLAPQLAEAVANAPEHVPCPVHGGADGYRLFDHYIETGRGICNTCGPQKSGFETLAWVKGYTFKDAVRDVANWLRKEDPSRVRAKRQPVAMRPKVDPAVAYSRIRTVWKTSLALTGTAAERYLVKRGIWRQNLPATLRAHEGLTYIHGKERTNYGKFPCLLAPIKDKNGTIVSIHRIFLTQEGDKAPVPDAKNDDVSAQRDSRRCHQAVSGGRSFGRGRGHRNRTGRPRHFAHAYVVLRVCRPDGAGGHTGLRQARRHLG